MCRITLNSASSTCDRRLPFGTAFSISTRPNFATLVVKSRLMSPIQTRQAALEDAEILTDLAYTTFWDAFAHHPKNAPDDLAYYMRQAFSLDQISAELADPKSLFLIAEIDG